MPPLPLFKQFIGRALRRSPGRSLVAVLGIAAGVAVMVAIRLANVSVTETFRAAVDAVGGETGVRVRGVAGAFDETRLADLGWLEEFGVVSPVIQTHAMLPPTPEAMAGAGAFPRGELLSVLGVDILRDASVRDYQVLRTGADDRQSATQVLGLLRDTDSIILTEKFLRRHGLQVGGVVPLVFDSTPKPYNIRGVLLDEGPAKTLDGSFALMDIASAQLAAGKAGLIDYLDLRLTASRGVDETVAALNERLPDGLIAETPEASFGRTDSMLSAFQFNLEALSSIALIVGLFLIYNTLSISVAARRNEIGILRAAGASRRQVLGLFLGEAALLTAAGLLVGLPLGRLMASYAVQGAAQTVETFYIAGVAESSAGALALSPIECLLASALVLPLALLAAAAPAWDAAKTAPASAVRPGAGDSKLSPLRLLKWSLLLVVAGAALTWVGPVGGKPVFGFVAELLFMAAGAMLTPLVLQAACHAAPALARPFSPAAGLVARLAGANLLASLSRVSVSTAALAVSLAMMVAIAVMVGSFRETMTYWLESALSADLAIKPVMQSSAVSEARLSKETVEKLTSDEAIADALWITSKQLPVGERSIRLAVTPMAPATRRAGLLFKAPRGGPPADETDWGQSVLVSESLALRRGLAPGDPIDLPTPAGVRSLTVAGVYYDYASNQGTVILDESAYRKFFAEVDPDPTPSNLSLYLHEGADADATRRRLLDSLGPDEQVYCVTNGEIRREAMRIFDSTFTVTYALQAIAILVAGLGVATTLVTTIYQRQREIGLLSLVGATAGKVKQMLLCEAVVLGATSQAIGVVVGLLLAYVLIFVVNVQAFGWTIQFHLPWRFLAVASAIVVATSALFGLYPATRAAGADPLQTVRSF
ncbi:MAG: FtsX-like permease family protein [Planctomycetota bacterium]